MIFPKAALDGKSYIKAKASSLPDYEKRYQFKIIQS